MLLVDSNTRVWPGCTTVLGMPELAYMQSMSGKAWTLCDPDVGVRLTLMSAQQCGQRH